MSPHIGYTNVPDARDLIEFAKTGAPPALAVEGNTSDHAWVDNSPTYAAVLTARDAKPMEADQFGGFERAVPRLREQKPYVDECRCPKGYQCDRRCGEVLVTNLRCEKHGSFTGTPGNVDCPYCTKLVRQEAIKRVRESGIFESPHRKRPESLNDFVREVHRDNAHWWHDPATGVKLYRNMGEMLMLVVSEIAECMEGERKDLMDTHLTHRKMAEVELADAIIRIADIAGSLEGGLPLKFATRLMEIAGTDATESTNKGEQLRRICVPLCAVTNLRRSQFLANKLARAWHRIELYAEKYGYDLWGAVAEKREYNKHRADHKPEARLAANGKKF